MRWWSLTEDEMAILVDLEEADTGQPVIERPVAAPAPDASPADRLRFILGGAL